MFGNDPSEPRQEPAFADRPSSHWAVPRYRYRLPPVSRCEVTSAKLFFSADVTATAAGAPGV
jgi:hypothetical protein